MAEVVTPAPLTLSARIDQMFPTLTAAQIARVPAHGYRRPIRAGEVLVEAGAGIVPLLLVTAGQVEIVQSSGTAETLIAVQKPGQFTGEIQILSGRSALFRVRASKSGEVIELAREGLLSLVQTDSELSEIIMRAFILRRVDLIAHGFGDVVLIGSNHSAGTLHVKEFLTRNSHPYAYLDLDRDADVQDLLDQFHVSAEDVPVLICLGEVVLRNPPHVSHDRRHSQYRLADRWRRARCQGVHQDPPRSVHGRTDRVALAARRAAISAGNEFARRFRGGRRARGQHQACRVRGRGGLNISLLRASGAPRVKELP
jgi:CRP-like cAMP-binding protein